MFIKFKRIIRNFKYFYWPRLVLFIVALVVIGFGYLTSFMIFSDILNKLETIAEPKKYFAIQIWIFILVMIIGYATLFKPCERWCKTTIKENKEMVERVKNKVEKIYAEIKENQKLDPKDNKLKDSNLKGEKNSNYE